MPGKGYKAERIITKLPEAKMDLAKDQSAARLIRGDQVVPGAGVELLGTLRSNQLDRFSLPEAGWRKAA